MLTSDIVEDDRIRNIINADYKNKQFVGLMRSITKEAIESNTHYKECATKDNLNLDNINDIDDLASIPYVSAPLFKESTGMYEKLLKIPLESPEFELWNVSINKNFDELHYYSQFSNCYILRKINNLVQFILR